MIATSTKVDLTGFKVDDKFTDAYFARPAAAAKKAEFIEGAEAKGKTVDPARVADQQAVDAKITAAIKKVPHLNEYLHSSFSLKSGQFPHAMKF